MKSINDLLLLGDERLYAVSSPVEESEFDKVAAWVEDLDNVMREIRAKYNFGRAISAPQLGIMKRLIYLNIDEPSVFINPVLSELSEEMFEVWDDCMSFPNLLVKVGRHRSLKVTYLDSECQSVERRYEDDMSELIQHEFDHLNGILCTMRAIDEKSFKWKK